MDPNTALDNIIDAAIDGDAEKMLELATGLAEWMLDDGFAPTANDAERVQEPGPVYCERCGTGMN